MNKRYQTSLVRRLSGATENQLKYWLKIGLIAPKKIGKTHFYSFRDLIKLRLIISLKKGGLSLQKIKKGIDNLSKILPDNDITLSRLVIYTDGIEMIVNEKGKYFSATSMQRFFRFDTEKLEADVIHLAKDLKGPPETADAVSC